MNSGIYLIFNKTNQKIYVGSTSNFNKRWSQHIATLQNNKHSNSHLQRSWNKYREENFIFTVWEECSIEELFNREQYYLDTLKPSYNVYKLLVVLVDINIQKKQKKKFLIV